MPPKAKQSRPSKKAPIPNLKSTAKEKVQSSPSKNQRIKPVSDIQIQKQPSLSSSKNSPIRSNNGISRELHVGDIAPVFSLPDDTGKIVKLSEYRGKKVVLYFYPKDDTPGCTTEACSFRDGIQSLKQKGAVVFGVSADAVSSHRKFSDKYNLNFPLLSDESKAMIQAYGVWKEKSLYGRKYMGIERTTVVIDEEGKIKTIFPKVKVDGHLTEVLENLG